MLKTKTGRIAIHTGALLIETVGTWFIFMDAKRMDARNPVNAITMGDPMEYRHWYYHFGLWGFRLLFAGIILAGFVLLLEHRAHVKTSPAPAPQK